SPLSVVFSPPRATHPANALAGCFSLSFARGGHPYDTAVCSTAQRTLSGRIASFFRWRQTEKYALRTFSFVL
ncbi:MAG: hypothetical protein IIZ26_01195, partial [Oscillospiraceae bacterium]|nr:hypothetical protein [Oscillospiraceae bacterium]